MGSPPWPNDTACDIFSIFDTDSGYKIVNNLQEGIRKLKLETIIFTKFTIAFIYFAKLQEWFPLFLWLFIGTLKHLFVMLSPYNPFTTSLIKYTSLLFSLCISNAFLTAAISY